MNICWIEFDSRDNTYRVCMSGGGVMREEHDDFRQAEILARMLLGYPYTPGANKVVRVDGTKECCKLGD